LSKGEGRRGAWLCLNDSDLSDLPARQHDAAPGPKMAGT
jgi:hypothetical protein